MTGEAWVIATDARRLGAMVSAVRGIGGRVTVVAIGPRSLAETAAAAGPDAVTWIEAAADVPAEAYAPTLRSAISAAEPRVVLAAATPPGRALLGAAAAALDAVVISGILSMSLEGDTLVAERTDLGGRVLETVAPTRRLPGCSAGTTFPHRQRSNRHPSSRWLPAVRSTSGSRTRNR